MWVHHVLSDHRIEAAISAAHAQTGHPILDIIMAVLTNLPLILADLNNPAALIALIISLLPKIPPVPSPTPAPTPAPTPPPSPLPPAVHEAAAA